MRCWWNASRGITKPSLQVRRVYISWLEGGGSFTINDKKENAAPDDVFIISDSDVYEYEGKMKIVRV